MLVKYRFQQINAIHFIFTTSLELNKPIISIFLDDIKIIMSEENGLMTKQVIELISAFQIVDMSLISLYQGLKVEENNEKK